MAKAIDHDLWQMLTSHTLLEWREASGDAHCHGQGCHDDQFGEGRGDQECQNDKRQSNNNISFVSRSGGKVLSAAVYS